MATISQTDEPRRRAYGRNLLGGVRAFHESRSDHLHQIVVIHQGAVDGLVQFWMDGEPVQVEAMPGAVPDGGRINRYTAVFFRDGSGAGGDYTGAFDGDPLGWQGLEDYFPELWTADHRLDGQATFYLVLGDPADEDLSKFFPKGSQTQMQAEVRGVRVADLNGNMIYSENSGLCIRDLFTHSDGWKIPLDRLDAESWEAFVAICAAPVALADGRTEPRYRLCGYYTLEDALKDVTERMLATCDGQVYKTAEGTIGIIGGVWSEPDVTITGDDILSVDMADGYDPLRGYNILHGSFVSPAHGYQPTDVESRRDEDALQTEEERPDRLDVDMCPSGSQQQRLMSIKSGRDRRENEGTIRTNLVGMKARFPKGDGRHTIRLNAPEFNLVGVFEVTGHVFSVPDGFCEIGIASLPASVYAWNPAIDEKPLPLTYASIGTPDNIQPPPQNAVLAQEYVSIGQGVQAVQLAVSVDDPGKDSLTFQAQIAPGFIEDVTPEDREAAGLPDYDWVEMVATRRRAVSGVLDDGQTYTVRIKWKGRTEWVRAGSVQVLSHPDVPDAPSAFGAMATGSTVYLDWINAGDDFYRTQIWRGTTTDFAAATFVKSVSGLPGEASQYSDTVSGSGTRHYWAVTINGSGIPSDPAGPVGVDILPA